MADKKSGELKSSKIVNMDEQKRDDMWLGRLQV